MILDFQRLGRITRLIAACIFISFGSHTGRAESHPVTDQEFAAKQAATQKMFNEKVTPFLKNYCTECHGDKKQKGGLSFRASLKAPGNGAFTKQWKSSAAIIKAHDMPPEDAPKQPTEEERQMFLDWVADLKFLSPKDPGLFVIRRLTKEEYANTLHDFLGVDRNVVRDLPDEVSGAGYLNSLSPLLMEQYLAITNEVLHRLFPADGTTAQANHSRLFGPAPAANAESRESAQHAVRALARKAFRRPPSDSEVGVLMEIFDLATRNARPYPEALRLVLKGILISPQFLFITPAKESDESAEIVALDDHQLASRLSYLCWATMPDAELAALADAGQLHQPDVLGKQVKRLLMDPRSRALFDGFGAQWLGLGKLAGKTFDQGKFPQMSPALRTAMYEEGRMLFESIVRENRSLLTFINSDYTFLNETLAPLYGMEKQVTGSEMRKVSLTNANRGGILGMPGILASTSLPNRTSPVIRGVWVLEQVLGEHVPPAPPNVPSLEKQDKAQTAGLTLRQRTELHRTNAVCANCHKILDPIGFGLENFDAIGRWRERDDSGGPIDASGELPGDKRFTSPKELKAILAERAPDLSRNLTGKFLAYSLCRQLEGYDEIVLDGLTDTIAKDGYRMQTLITEVVTSYPFTHRRTKEPSAPSNEKKLAN